MIDHIGGMDLGIKAKGFIIVNVKFGDSILRNTAFLQRLLYLLFGYRQGFRNLAFLVHCDLLAQLIMDILHHVYGAFFLQATAEQGLEGLFLFVGRLCHGRIEHSLHKGFVVILHILTVIQGIVDIGCPMIESRK